MKISDLFNPIKFKITQEPEESEKVKVEKPKPEEVEKRSIVDMRDIVVNHKEFLAGKCMYIPLGKDTYLVWQWENKDYVNQVIIGKERAVPIKSAHRQASRIDKKEIIENYIEGYKSIDIKNMGESNAESLVIISDDFKNLLLSMNNDVVQKESILKKEIYIDLQGSTKISKTTDPETIILSKGRATDTNIRDKEKKNQEEKQDQAIKTVIQGDKYGWTNSEDPEFVIKTYKIAEEIIEKEDTEAIKRNSNYIDASKKSFKGILKRSLEYEYPDMALLGVATDIYKQKNAELINLNDKKSSNENVKKQKDREENGR